MFDFDFCFCLFCLAGVFDFGRTSFLLLLKPCLHFCWTLYTISRLSAVSPPLGLDLLPTINFSSLYRFFFTYCLLSIYHILEFMDRMDMSSSFLSHAAALLSLLSLQGQGSVGCWTFLCVSGTLVLSVSSLTLLFCLSPAWVLHGFVLPASLSFF